MKNVLLLCPLIMITLIMTGCSRESLSKSKTNNVIGEYTFDLVTNTNCKSNIQKYYEDSDFNIYLVYANELYMMPSYQQEEVKKCH